MGKTRRKATKPVRRRSTSTRRRAPRLSERAIETTLAELAHEIRTPLTGILALGELLATAGLPAREREWATAIKSTGEHLAMLTSLIVDAARANAGGLVLRRDLIRLRPFLQSLAASLDARAQNKNLACEVSIAPDLPEAVIGDAADDARGKEPDRHAWFERGRGGRDRRGHHVAGRVQEIQFAAIGPPDGHDPSRRGHLPLALHHRRG
jgi:signal transduction histidine kinase